MSANRVSPKSNVLELVSSSRVIVEQGAEPSGPSCDGEIEDLAMLVRDRLHVYFWKHEYVLYSVQFMVHILGWFPQDMLEILDLNVTSQALKPLL
jgi:hypothetical protein